MRRWGPPLNGVQFCGNRNKMEVHDLDNEITGDGGCQIDEIIIAGHSVHLASLADAKLKGYDNCAKCIGGSHR